MFPQVTVAIVAYASLALCAPAVEGGCLDSGPADYSLLRRNVSVFCPLGSGEESNQVGSSPVTWPWQIYQSAPFNPPVLEIAVNGEPLAEGLLFITPSDASRAPSAKDIAPLIMTDRGQLVWGGPMVNATNFRVAEYKGHTILTFWSGISTAGANTGHGYGNVTFLDTSYNEILTVCPQFGLVTPGNDQYPCEADLHESFVTDRNTILITAYNATQTDLRSVGGPKEGWVFDCLFFELDPASGDILFKWSALEHVSVSDTQLPLGGTGLNQSVPFDFFHINSVVNVGATEYLINSRHFWSTYLISSQGNIIWTIQGDTGGDFGPLPENGRFAWQHYARPHNVSDQSFSISWFNNNNAGGFNGTNQTTGLEVKLALPPNKVEPPLILRDFTVPDDPIFADSQGSLSFLGNGDVFLDYGMIALLREYGPNGELRWSAKFGGTNVVQSYRGFKKEWHATPKTDPSLTIIAGSTLGGCGSGYVSWNGATDVTAWKVFEGPSNNHLSLVGEVRYRGFETKFTVAQECVQVVAMVNGAAGAKSSIVCA